MRKLIKSKQRVRDLAEVFTPPHIVDDMLDLVKDESYRIDSRFFEPSCGNGAFLRKILLRKIFRILRNLKGIEVDLRHPYYHFYYPLIMALTSIYGIDISKENVIESREFLLKKIIRVHYLVSRSQIFKNKKCPKKLNADIKKTAIYILKKNIVLGDTINKPQEIFLSEFKICKSCFTASEVVYNLKDMIECNSKNLAVPIIKDLNPSGTLLLLAHIHRNEKH